MNAISSILMGCAAGWLAWSLIGIITQKRKEFEWDDRFEKYRRDTLRAGNSTYRWFEPLIDELSAITQGKKDEEFSRQLALSKDKLPWKPAEYSAKNIVEGVAIGVGLGGLLFLFGWKYLALIVSVPIVLFYPQLGLRSIADQSVKRMQQLRRRLPFVVDQLALMMEAGASFTESLTTAVRENREHPIGEEFGAMLRQIDHGRTRSDAFTDLQERLHDEDVSEMVLAVTKGEELGTPLSKILRRQADQMRLKRSQWGEKAAAQAQVKIVFPGMLVMIACLLVVITPIILPAISSMIE